MSFLVLSSVSLLIMVTQPCFGGSRTLRVPVVASDPNNCLYRKTAGLYCWYILRDKHQVNGGMRLLSNSTGVTSFTSLELSAVLDSGGHPQNVGFWVEGTTAYSSVLFGDVKLDLYLNVPAASRETGRAFEDRWELGFPFSVRSTVQVPHIGSITAIGNATASAIVKKNGNAYMVLDVDTFSRSGSSLSALCGFTVIIRSEDLVTWYYEAYAYLYVKGNKGGYTIQYDAPVLNILDGSLK
ncbi:hypothetical protein FOL47_009869 [Perkinsus chesapeaki]|uniref:Uncharacterized protein n=1 Tax=Perkinsus chesapeaki TaxID=330153 RepID=A0A7J6L609_PERCH|nr:hypothetical protein FOL47_009869 [Perkinsus chesapeaki]